MNKNAEFLVGVLDFMAYQLREDKCTQEQVDGIMRSVKENVPISASISDIATHYNQAESNVSNIISRKYIGKPERKVFYNFTKLIEHLPDAWKKKGARK